MLTSISMHLGANVGLILNYRVRTSERRKRETIEHKSRPEQDHEVEILERGQISGNSSVID
jgi:hypothetical protein